MGMPRRPDQDYTPPPATVGPGSQSGVFRGRLVVVGGTAPPTSGVLVYSPVAGAGNLIASLANAGTDQYGNVVLPVITAYGPNGQSIQLVDLGGVLEQNFHTGSATEAAPGQLKAGTVNTGAANEQQQLIVGGPTNTVSNDAGFISLNASFHNQANSAAGQLSYQLPAGGDQPLVQWGGAGVFRWSPAGLNGGVPLTQMDTFARSVTTNVLTALSPAYTIPANDATGGSQQQTIYEIEADGFGTWPNPTQVFGWTITFLGASLQFVINAGGTATDGFNWSLKARVVTLTTGSTGTVRLAFPRLLIRDSTTGAPFFAAPNFDTSSHTVNTTVAGTIQLSGNWSAGGAGATLTSSQTILQRIGA